MVKHPADNGKSGGSIPPHWTHNFNSRKGEERCDVVDLVEPREQMTKTINYLEDQLVGVRWGTITPAVVDLVRLDYHGQNMPIKHLAHTTMDSGRIMVRAFDPTVLGSIDKALQKAGFNSYVFSKEAVCVAVPPPSGDQKNEVIARVKRVGEEAKVSIRVMELLSEVWQKPRTTPSVCKNLDFVSLIVLGSIVVLIPTVM